VAGPILLRQVQNYVTHGMVGYNIQPFMAVFCSLLTNEYL